MQRMKLKVCSVSKSAGLNAKNFIYHMTSGDIYWVFLELSVAPSRQGLRKIHGVHAKNLRRSLGLSLVRAVQVLGVVHLGQLAIAVDLGGTAVGRRCTAVFVYGVVYIFCGGLESLLNLLDAAG